MSYILQNPATVKFKEKRSEFIAYTKSLNATDELSNHLKELKSLHPTARHFCWAYRLANGKEVIENSSDAGEPSGSAGLPILNAIKSKNIVNCAIIVVRYFGGVKLGKQGLIKSYRYTAEQVIANSDIQVWVPKVTVLISADILQYGNVVNTIKRFSGKIVSDSSGEQLELVVELKEKEFEGFKTTFDEITQRIGTIKKQSEHDQTKEVRK